MHRIAMTAALSLASAVAASAAEENMVGNQTQNEGLSVVPAKGPVTVDGFIDPAEWDLSGQIWSFADWDSRETFSVKTAAMWDKDFLYLAFDWRDPMPLNAKCNPREDPSHGWQCDAIQLRSITPEGLWTWITMWAYEGDKPAFDVEYPDKTNRRDTRAMHRLLYPGKPGVWELGEGVAVGYRKAEDGRGFTQEVRLPWSVFKPETPDATVAPGEVFKLGLEFYWAQPSGTGWPLHGYKDNLQPGVVKREFFWTSDNAWGDATIRAEGNVPKRAYRRRSYRPEGAIALRAPVPAGSEFFSLVLDGADGRRVRNVAGGCRVDEFAVATDAAGNPVVEVMWDGLDEAGAPAEPGAYRVATLGSGALDGWWETSFYNPGTPPWGTADGKGAWGADHNAVSRVARAGDAMVLCSAFAEGGYGTFAVDAGGRKLWSDVRGSSVVAGNARHAFIVPNDWEHTGDQLLRIDAATGAYAPFAPGGDMPLRLVDLLRLGPGATPSKVLGLAATDEELVMLFGDNTIRIFDAANGAYRRGFVLHASQIARNGAPLREGNLGGSGELCPFAADAASAYFFFGRELRRMDLATGSVETVPLEVPVGVPAALALGPDGSVCVADGGPDSQVKRYDPATGRLLGRIGRTGGRALQGPFERDGMRCVTGIAFDAAGRLWAAEDQRHPRRVSVWGPDGAFVRDFLGTTGYAGQGTTLHLDDPTRAYAELNEISIDPKTGAWDVVGTLFNPPPPPPGALVVRPGQTHFHNGEAFCSRASGEEREYFSVLGWRAGTAFFLMMRENGVWSPVAAIAPLAALLDLMGGPYNARVILDTHGAWKDHDPAEMVVWNDLDNDGYLTPEECEFVPPTSSGRPHPGAPGDAQPRLEDIVSFFPVDNSPVSPEDLGFTAMRADPATGRRAWGRVVPVGFRDGGRPVYSARGFRPYENFPASFTCESEAATAIPGRDVTVGFLKIDRRDYVAGWRTSTGEILWRYASPFHSVHGSHDAPMPHPGLLIGCLKVVGQARDCGDSDVVMVRGNLGEDYFLTADGFFVNRLTRDGRLPGNPTPEDPALLRKTSFATLNGRGEPFSGTFTRHRDGVLRATFPFPANQAGNVVRIEGLDSLRHGPAVDFEATEADLARAAADREARALAASRPAEPLRIARLAAGARPDWDALPAAEIVREGLSTRTSFRAAAAPDALHLRWDVRGDASPWRNGARDWHLLFKGGDCVDFQLSPSGSRDGADGDFRLLVAPFQGGAAAVLMRPRLAGAPETARFSYNSPVQTVVFDSVTKLGLAPEVEVGDDSFRVTLAVPWALLGMEAPAPGTTLRGDVGVILSDAAGTVNAARVYRSNRHTNLVNDQPGEAVLQPAGWSEIVFE